VKACLNAITEAARTGSGNLLEKAVEAARARASLGEISDAMEKVFGRHKAVIRAISGVYSSEFGDAEEIATVRQMADEFEQRKAAGRASWSPSSARTVTTGAPRSSRPRSPTSVSTWTSARCSRRPMKSPAKRWRTTCMSSA
jgi:hypothetical protein